MSLSRKFRTLCLGLLYVSLAVALAYEPVRLFMEESGHEHWGLTVWLINFQGGFVRRGWPGEVIYQAWQSMGLSPRMAVIVISYALLAIMLISAWRQLRRLYPPEILLSSALFGTPLLAHTLLQKDILVIVFFMMGLAICRHTRSAPLAFALAALVIVVAVLSHETFLFFGAPALILAFGLRQYQAGLPLLRALLSLWPLVVATMGATALASHFKGSPEIAQAVHDSWLPLWQQIGGAGCCTEPAASFRALGWSLRQGIEQQAIVLDDFSFFIYVPAAWVLTAVVLFFLAVKTARIETRAERLGLAGIFLLQFAAVAPMFVIGLDFGRWLFAWVATSALLVAHVQTASPGLMGRFYPGNRTVPSQTWRIHPAFLLIFAVPATQWSVYAYLQATPLGGIAFPAWRLFEAVTGIDLSLGRVFFPTN